MGSIAKTLAPITGGFAQERASRFQAKQLEQQSQAVEAQGMRRAAGERKRAEGILGTAQAMQVAGGGSASDPSAIKQQAKIKSRGEFNALAQIFGAGEVARGKRLQAKSARLTGKIAKQQGILEGLATGGDEFAAFMGGG